MKLPIIIDDSVEMSLKEFNITFNNCETEKQLSHRDQNISRAASVEADVVLTWQNLA